ncbi:hypothetical protein Syun_027771 [Stephania yunnanensis]|uniref:Integrase catalytic domain-containing protein n=1 Tax=Stephania yunnanensis TaxID=152371 RepID=A0AAP0EG60_9MAGN
MQERFDTQLRFSIAFHSHTDGKSEWLIQILEDMLRSCVLEYGGFWEKYISLCKFSYNNNYQSSIGMMPFEALYGRPCRAPSCWSEPEVLTELGPQIVRDHTEAVEQIHQKLKAAQNRQKSYYDLYHRVVEYNVGDWVYLKVSPRKTIVHIWVERKTLS